jgi:hypothetical protein
VGTVVVTTGLLTASVGVAAPGEAAAGRTVTSAHVSLSAVVGALPAGAGITVVQTCPRGSDLDRRATRAAGEVHDPHLRRASREYWPAGVATRYRVRTSLRGTADLALTAGVVVCRIHVGAHARVVTGRASTDLRVWGPAPAKVDLLDVTVMATTDPAHPDRLLRTAVRGTGVGSSRGSLRHAVSAVQETFDAQVVGGVVALGTTRRAVPRGRFASMENRYRFRVVL